MTLVERLLCRDTHIVFYGTSLTRSGTWPELLLGHLAARRPPGPRASNQAANGQHSRWGLEHFQERVLQAEPDVLFLEFAINDAVARFALPVAESRRHHEQMLDQLARARPQCAVVLQVMNPVVGRPAGHDGYRPCLCDYEQLVRDLASERNLTLVDHAPAWAALLQQGEAPFRAYVPDGLHPNPAGERALLLPTLLSALGLIPTASPLL